MQQISSNIPFYQISQVSKILNITCDRLRAYEEEGLIKPKRSGNSKDGKRLFSLDEIEWLIAIRDLIKLGVTIPTIRILLLTECTAPNSSFREKDLEIMNIIKKLKSHPVYKSIFMAAANF